MYAQFFVYKKTEKPGEAWHVTDALRFGNASPPASDQRWNNNKKSRFDFFTCVGEKIESIFVK